MFSLPAGILRTVIFAAIILSRGPLSFIITMMREWHLFLYSQDEAMGLIELFNFPSDFRSLDFSSTCPNIFLFIFIHAGCTYYVLPFHDKSILAPLEDTLQKAKMDPKNDGLEEVPFLFNYICFFLCSC